LALPERVNGRLLIAMMEADPVPRVQDHNQADATGFIQFNALCSAKRDRGEGAEEKVNCVPGNCGST